MKLRKLKKTFVFDVIHIGTKKHRLGRHTFVVSAIYVGKGRKLP